MNNNKINWIILITILIIVFVALYLTIKSGIDIGNMNAEDLTTPTQQLYMFFKYWYITIPITFIGYYLFPRYKPRKK